jgi:hypothetical protein
MFNIIGTITTTAIKACTDFARFSTHTKHIRLGGLKKPLDAFKDLLQATRCCADKYIPNELRTNLAENHVFESCRENMQQEFCKLGMAKMIYKYEAPLLETYVDRIQKVSSQLEDLSCQLNGQINKIFTVASLLFATDISDYLVCELATKYRFSVLGQEVTKVTLAFASLSFASCFVPINLYEAALGYAIKSGVNKIVACATKKIGQ